MIRVLAVTAGIAFATVLPAAAALCQPPPPGSCHTKGQLPDRACTPGVADPAVTQANIRSTICRAGYTATVRPTQAYTSAMKRQQMAAYGLTGSPSAYEEDHLISLELGGSPRDGRNLWPELGAAPNVKDRTEGRLRKAVCAGRISLAEAQSRISTDWTTATRGL